MGVRNVFQPCKCCTRVMCTFIAAQLDAAMCRRECQLYEGARPSLYACAEAEASTKFQRLREEETKLPLKRRPTACLLTAVHADWDAHCRSTQADAIWLDSCMAAIHLDQTSKSK